MAKLVKKYLSHVRRYTKSVRKRLGVTGRQVKKHLGLGQPITSAGSYSYNRGEYYGPTGSIVGRY